MDEKQYYTDIIASLAERTIKRLWIIIILLIVLLVGTNAMWIHYESSFADEVTTVTQEAEADGDSNISLRNIGGDYYGSESEADSHDEKANP